MSQLARNGRARPSHDFRRIFSTTWLETTQWLDSDCAFVEDLRELST